MDITREHYDHHLAHFYTWMQGDFETRRQEQEDFFVRHGVRPSTSKLAIDLGCGNGIQSVALARLGFKVTAIDFSKILLEELRQRRQNLDIDLVEMDIVDFKNDNGNGAEVAVCMGDTITHLPDQAAVRTLLRNATSALTLHGKLILSYRDLSTALIGTQRFIPLRSDETKIHTCFLEYFPDHVMVTDLLYEHNHGQWALKASSYPKLKLPMEIVIGYLLENNLHIRSQENIRGMQFIVAERLK